MKGIKHYELEDGLGQPSPSMSAADLKEIFETSPALAGLLPDLMRRMADEIEMISDSQLSGATDQLPCHGSAAESLARRVAFQISITLSNHLMLSRTDHAAGTGTARPHNTPEKPLQPRVAGIYDHATRPRLTLKLLGTPEITLDGVRLIAVELCSRAALVIYVLALHPGGLSGQRLTAYLVSESEDVDAFDIGAILSPSAHRTFIWRLRKLAGWREIVTSHCEQGGRQNRYILPAVTTCDVWEFEDNLDQAARLVVRAGVEPDAVDRAAALRQEAILLYGGDFCEDVGAGAIARAADYLRHRYLQAVISQAAYWKDKAIKLEEVRQRDSIRGDLSIEEENAWLEALNNYRLAVHVEPYEESAYAGVVLCQARLGQRNMLARTGDSRMQMSDSELESSSVPPTVHTSGESRQLPSNLVRCQ